MKRIIIPGILFILLMLQVGHCVGAVGPVLTAAQEEMLARNWQTIQHKKKGPYSQNYCVCSDGSRELVLQDGIVADRCTQTNFCAAFRAPSGVALATAGMYVGNIFSSDLLDWDTFADHHDLVRGYILENFYMSSHPRSKLAQMQGYRGLKGAEYEARDMPVFQEKYLEDKSYNDYRHFILAYELQRRFFSKKNQGSIQNIRDLAGLIYNHNNDFKSLRDAVHGRIAASLLPQLTNYRDNLPLGQNEIKQQVSELMTQIEQLTSLDQSILTPQISELSAPAIKKQLQDLIDRPEDTPIKKINSLARLMVISRQAVATRQVVSADLRRLIDINVTVAAVIQSLGSKVMDDGGPVTIKESLYLLQSLANGTYGTGLISEREQQAISADFDIMLARDDWDRETFISSLKHNQRVIEWAHTGALLAFGEVLPAWTYLIPDISRISDDIVRSSPMLLYGMVFSQLEDSLSGKARISHLLIDKEFTEGVRALNPGLAFGELAVVDLGQQYDRSQIIALPDTPADLAPVAGIITRGEGNVVSHVQLLARALGIPNVVVNNSAYENLKKGDKDKVLFIVTSGGMVYLKRAADMTAEDQRILKEYTGNQKPSDDGTVSRTGARLHIDPDVLDLKNWKPIPLKDLRRADSGIKTGPKAAYLGELKHMFPDNVARGVAVPFAAYYLFYTKAQVVVPADLVDKKMAQPGQPLDAFVRQTYKTFFEEMIPSGADERTLSTWIKPRLHILRHSIRENELPVKLKTAITDNLKKLGLLKKEDPSQTVGLFVRSDTNVEDQPNFNGAGLNLTIFNLGSLDDIFRGLKEVWASPFTYRSFSWRQTMIDEPLWVLPSVVLLETVPSEASGVLITADINTGDHSKMILATSEGVGGAVDGTPAETLLWSPETIELLTTFKSPWRKVIIPGSGMEIIPSSGREYVLSPKEVNVITAAASKIRQTFEPSLDKNGKPMAWDIEYGFANGRFQ